MARKQFELGCMAFACAMLGAASDAQSIPLPPQPPPQATPAPVMTAAAAASTRSVALLPEATTPLLTQTDFVNQPLHLLVGRSMFIKSVSRLKRVYVSNPAVIDSFTSTPHQIVVTAKDAGVSSLILWDEGGQSTTYLLFSDLDVASLQKEIRQAMPNDRITVEAQQDRIALTGTVLAGPTVEAATKLAALYSKNVVNYLVVDEPHTQQVRLKVQIIEVDRTKLSQFGINLFSYGKNQSGSTTGQFPSSQTYTPGTGGTPSTLTTNNPLNLMFYNFGLNVGLTIQDLLNNQVAQILAEPTITTLSGQKGSFLAGGEFPFPVVQGSSGGLTSITIQFRPYGVKLEFTPVVNSDHSIQLKVAPEVSALDYTNAVTISGYTIPAISTRRAETQVELRDGQGFAISGLLDRRTTDIFNKMPGIGDVPVLGQLFRSKNINHSTVELMVVVTPTIVDPLHQDYPPVTPSMPVPLLDPAQFDKAQAKKTGGPVKPGRGGVQ